MIIQTPESFIKSYFWISSLITIAISFVALIIITFAFIYFPFGVVLYEIITWHGKIGLDIVYMIGSWFLVGGLFAVFLKILPFVSPASLETNIQDEIDITKYKEFQRIVKSKGGKVEIW